jgi:type III secretion protein V
VLERRQPFTTCGPAGFIALNLTEEIRRNAGHFLTTEVVKCSLNLLREHFPILVDTVLGRFDILQLTAVLRDLLHEEISIRDLRSILESLLSIEGWGVSRAACDVAWCSRWVRSDLKRQISHKFSRGSATLAVHQLDSELEARVVESDRRLLTQEEQRRLLTTVSKAVDESSLTEHHTVILTTSEARRKFRRLIKQEFPSLAVLSYDELSPDMNIKPLGKLAWREL